MAQAVESSRWDTLDSQQVYPGITRQVIHGERQTMVRYVYAPGSEFPAHHHAEEQITVVISGSIRFVVDGRTIDLGPGEVAVIPPNVEHGATVVGNETVVTYNAMSPRRLVQPGEGNA